VLHSRVLRRILAFRRAGLTIAVSAVVVACGDRHAQPLDTASVKPCTDELASGSQPTDLFLATGLASGTYVQLGAAITRYGGTVVGRQIRACTTSGSGENLDLLRSHRNAAFALVQLDVLHYAAADGHLTSINHDTHDVRIVAYLYSEKLHVFVRPHRYLSSLADLGAIADKVGTNGISNWDRIWLGPGPGKSGGYSTASKVLEAAGVADEDIHRLGAGRTDLNWDRAADALLIKTDSKDELPPGALIAYFRTMAVPRRFTSSDAAGRVSRLLDADAQLMSLPSSLIDRLTEEGIYVPDTIKLGTYGSKMKRGVATIGVPTLLVTNLPDDQIQIVHDLERAIGDNKSSIEDLIGGIELDLWNKRDAVFGVEVHPGAAGHFRSPLPYMLWAGGLFVGLMVAMASRNPLWFRRRLAAGSYLLLLIATLSALWVLLSIAMMRAEGTLNPDFAYITDSLRNTLWILSGQTKDYRLMTPQGDTWRWLGLILFPVVVGWLMSDVLKELMQRASVRLGGIIRRAQRRDAHRSLIALAKLPKTAIDWLLRRRPSSRGAVVFLNWAPRGERLLEELRRESPLADMPVVVVLSEHAPYRPGSDLEMARVHEGDPAVRKTLERAGVADAAAVTILSAWTPTSAVEPRGLDPDMEDMKTILAILTIRSLCEEVHRTRALPVHAEIRLTRNQDSATGAAQDGPVHVTCLPV